jgi:hypothetical protein
MLLLLGLTACGGNGLPPSSSVTVTVTPSQATVPVGGTVTLTGSENGFTAGPVVSWWIQESKNIDPYNDCGKLDTQAKDFTGCPYGFVMFHDVTTVPSIATYYAPQTPGTYHVTLSMIQAVEFDGLEKTATATITVTP